MATVSEAIHNEFEKMYQDKRISPRKLERFIDKNIHHPSFVHFMYRQMIWMREDQEIMTRTLDREVGEAEALQDYQRRFSDDNYISYYLEYIVPAMCSPEKSKEIDQLPDGDRKFIGNVFDKVAKVVNIGEHPLLTKLAADIPNLASSIERKGLVAKYTEDKEEYVV